MTEAPRLLSDVRVVEIAGASGAYCGKLLADVGADVVKVEPPGGDASRGIGPFLGGVRDRERSLFFWHYNTGKRGVTLDLGSDEDRRRLDDLIARADVLLLTGSPSQLAAAGLEPYAQSGRHPRLIVAAISPFGLDGPRSEWKSCDTVAQALGGMAYVNGHAGEAPLRSFGLQAYHLAALHGATGVLLALLARERSGRGQVVDVSLQESVVAGLEHVTARFFSAREIAERRGTLHWGGAFRAGRCRDGLVLCSNAGDWTSLVEWLKSDGKAEDLAEPVWQSFAHRRAHAEHLFDVIDRWLAEHTIDEVVEGAQLRRLPFAPVLPVESLRAHPQLEARGFFVPVEREDVGATFAYPGAPYRFSRTPWRIERRAPRLGEHDAEVLAESSLSRMGEGQGEGDSMDLPSTPGSSRDRGESGSGVSYPPHPSPLPSGRGSHAEAAPLAGVRVLDFTWVVAGPAATRVLADHGADVIKVERPDTSDEAGERNGLRGALNRGKRSIVLDLSRPEGLEIARALAARCDVVIDNFSPRVMENWGLDPVSLRRINPGVIAVGMSGFGAGGPMRDHVSYGPTLQAIAGHTRHMCHPAGEPAGWGFSFSDMASGATAALAVLLALRHRERTGEGQVVDLAQLEALTALGGHHLLAASIGIGTAPPVGNRSPERAAAPHGIYRCRLAARDRWCAICVFTEREWRSFTRAIGSPAWARAERFASLAGRLAAEDELDARVEEWTSSRAAEDVAELLQGAGLAAGVVADAEDLSRDPQLRARGTFATVRTPEGGASTVDGPASRLSATPGRVRAAAPLPGEHTAGILREVLGLDETAVDRLRAGAVVR